MSKRKTDKEKKEQDGIWKKLSLEKEKKGVHMRIKWEESEYLVEGDLF